jgi:hypothetical protein
MATESGRVYKRKRIKLPTGDHVDFPVIAQISFLDVPERGQETQYTLDNTTDSDRTVRVASIPGGGDPTDESGGGGSNGDTSKTLQVERIDRFKLLDTPDRGRETFPEPDNKTIKEPPDAPPYFTTHEKTHIIKVLKREDDDSENKNVWIKTELIDNCSFVDIPERGQETQFTLFNPSSNNQDFDGLRFGTDDDGLTTVSVDSSMEEITSGVGLDSDGNGDPVRTDPFQNIVDFSSTVPIVFITWNFIPIVNFSTRTTTGMSLLAPAYPSPKSTADFSYTDAASADAHSDPFTRPDGVASSPPWILSIPNGGNDLNFNGGKSLTKQVPLFDGPYQVDGNATASITGTTVMVREKPGQDPHPYDCYATTISFTAALGGQFQYQGSIFVSAFYRKR